MRPSRSIALATLIVTAAITGAFALTSGGSSTGDAFAQSGSTGLRQILGQLRRNAKVSERLNAGFFRAPQTRQYAGSTFQPADNNIAYTADRGDSALSLDPTRPGREVREEGEGQNRRTVVERVPQTTGLFELALDVPNRAEVIGISASYRDEQGGNTTTAGTQAPSGFGFSVVRLGLLAENPEELLAAPSPAGVRSEDGKAGTFRLPIRNNGFRVDNSRNRYVVRVRIDDVNAATRLYGITVRYVIGRGVAGAPGSTQPQP